MAGYLIDTDVLIDYWAGDADVSRFVEALVPSGISLSAISYMEAFEGTLRSADPAAAAASLRDLLSQVPVIEVTVAVAERCAALRNELARLGRRRNSRALDLLIAATAMVNDLTVVTRNVADYRDLPGLELLPYSPGGRPVAS